MIQIQISDDALPVIVSGYGTAYTAKAGALNSSITLGLPDTLYSKEVGEIPVANFQHCSLTDRYRYMGSKEGYHFILHYPPLGLRNILKISKERFKVDDEFPLTSRSGKWYQLKLDKNYSFFNQPGFVYEFDHISINAATFDLEGLQLQPSLNLYGEGWGGLYWDALREGDGR